jgi:hypothetical protein
MATKHTAGPWATFDEETGEAKEGELSVGVGTDASDGPAIAWCNPLSNYEESQANAKLIAAAPDLLEVLDDAPLPSVQGRWDEFLPRYTAWLKRRTAAIARATN